MTDDDALADELAEIQERLDDHQKMAEELDTDWPFEREIQRTKLKVENLREHVGELEEKVVSAEEISESVNKSLDEDFPEGAGRRT